MSCIATTFDGKKIHIENVKLSKNKIKKNSSRFYKIFYTQPTYFYHYTFFPAHTICSEQTNHLNWKLGTLISADGLCKLNVLLSVLATSKLDIYFQVPLLILRVYEPFLLSKMYLWKSCLSGVDGKIFIFLSSSSFLFVTGVRLEYT